MTDGERRPTNCSGHQRKPDSRPARFSCPSSCALYVRETPCWASETNFSKRARGRHRACTRQKCQGTKKVGYSACYFACHSEADDLCGTLLDKPACYSVASKVCYSVCYIIICNLTGVRILQHAFFSETSSPAACILISPFAGLHLRRALLLTGIPTVCHLPHFAQHAPTDSPRGAAAQQVNNRLTTG